MTLIKEIKLLIPSMAEGNAAAQTKQPSMLGGASKCMKKGVATGLIAYRTRMRPMDSGLGYASNSELIAMLPVRKLITEKSILR